MGRHAACNSPTMFRQLARLDSLDNDSRALGGHRFSDHKTKPLVTATPRPVITLAKFPRSAEPVKGFLSLPSPADTPLLRPEKQRIRRVMATFWMVRKKFSP